jgi:hypothetical protein
MLLLTQQGVYPLATESLDSALYDRSGERRAAALAPTAALAAQAAISGRPILALPLREDAALAAARIKQGKTLWIDWHRPHPLRWQHRTFLA